MITAEQAYENKDKNEYLVEFNDGSFLPCVADFNGIGVVWLNRKNGKWKGGNAIGTPKALLAEANQKLKDME